MIDLAGKVALVTGSSRGIGKACALRLAEGGADVVINYVTSAKEAEQVAEQIAALGRRTACVRADVSQEEDVEEMLGFVRDQWGRLDILVHNAATGGFRPLEATTTRHFDAAMHTNVLSLVHLLKQAAPLLESEQAARGKVIVLSSHGTHMALPMYGLIGGSKAALVALARHWALELGDRGVNVNVVEAGLVADRQHQATSWGRGNVCRSRAKNDDRSHECSKRAMWPTRFSFSPAPSLI